MSCGGVAVTVGASGGNGGGGGGGGGGGVNAPWLPMTLTCVPRSLSTGTMCLPFVIVDIALGLKASPEKSTSGISAAKLLSFEAKRAAPADLSEPGSIV